VSEGERHAHERLANQLAEGHPAKFANEHTTHFACADASGTVVSVTQTLGAPFGSGFAIPGTGLVLNNILKWSDRDPASPNVLKSGRKAGTMMSPTQVFRDGAFALGAGSLVALAQVPPTRKALLRLKDPGEGPSPERRDKSWFNVRFSAEGGGERHTVDVATRGGGRGIQVAVRVQPEHAQVWPAVEQTGLPFYLHPRNPLARDAKIYEGHPWLLGPIWAFGHETAVHALRLMGCGLFDEHPQLQIVLGHLGERIPYDLWRLDHRLAKVPGRPARRSMSEYFRSNFHVATSGHFCTQSLIHAMMTLGADRVRFAVDYPFEDHAKAASWFGAVAIAEADRVKIGRSNAVRLFGLG